VEDGLRYSRPSIFYSLFPVQFSTRPKDDFTFSRSQCPALMTTSPCLIFTTQVSRYFSGSLFQASSTSSSSGVAASRFSMPLTTSTAHVPQEQLKQPASISTPAFSPASSRVSPAGTSAETFAGKTVTFGIAGKSKTLLENSNHSFQCSSASLDDANKPGCD